MKTSIITFWLFGVLVIPSKQIEAQGRGGYDQFGEYVEKAPIDEKANEKRVLHRLQKKLNDYQEKLKKEPHDFINNLMMGNLLIQLNQPNDAIKSYKKALKLNPLHGETHYNLAKAYDAVRDGENAIKHVQKADKIFRDNLYLHWQTKSRQLLKQLQTQYKIQ